MERSTAEKQNVGIPASVSKYVLQSSNLNAPDRAAQVVSCVKDDGFRRKKGVQAMTIVYPIDFCLRRKHGGRS